MVRDTGEAPRPDEVAETTPETTETTPETETSGTPETAPEGEVTEVTTEDTVAE